MQAHRAAHIKRSTPPRASMLDLLRQSMAFFQAPPPQPSIEARVASVVDAIMRAGAREVVLWVPGTNCFEVNADFNRELQRLRPGTPVVVLPYEASWRLRHSESDGAAVLRGVLQRLAQMPARPKLLLAGESQGAWAISDVVTDPRLHDVAERAVLIAHPGVATNHFEHDSRVFESNDRDDIVTRPMNPHARLQTVLGIDAIARRDVLGMVGHFATLAVVDLSLVGAFFGSQLIKSRGARNPHLAPDAAVHGARLLVADRVVTSDLLPD